MNTITCTATTKTGKLCKRPGYRWPNGKILCAPHSAKAGGNG